MLRVLAVMLLCSGCGSASKRADDVVVPRETDESGTWLASNIRSGPAKLELMLLPYPLEPVKPESLQLSFLEVAIQDVDGERATEVAACVLWGVSTTCVPSPGPGRFELVVTEKSPSEPRRLWRLPLRVGEDTRSIHLRADLAFDSRETWVRALKIDRSEDAGAEVLLQPDLQPIASTICPDGPPYFLVKFAGDRPLMGLEGRPGVLMGRLAARDEASINIAAVERPNETCWPSMTTVAVLPGEIRRAVGGRASKAAVSAESAEFRMVFWREADGPRWEDSYVRAGRAGVTEAVLAVWPLDGFALGGTIR